MVSGGLRFGVYPWAGAGTVNPAEAQIADDPAKALAAATRLTVTELRGALAGLGVARADDVKEPEDHVAALHRQGLGGAIGAVDQPGQGPVGGRQPGERHPDLFFLLRRLRRRRGGRDRSVDWLRPTGDQVVFGRPAFSTPIVKSENPIDNPAASPENARAAIVRSSSPSPSRRIVSNTTAAR